MRPPRFEPMTSPVYCFEIGEKEMVLGRIEMGILAEKNVQKLNK